MTRMSYQHCERIARREAANFYHAFRLLPTSQRLSMCALYSFLRISDDLADDSGDNKREVMQKWRKDFHAAMQGHFTHPIHAALYDTVQKHQIPVQYLTDALDGVEMDLDIDRYATFDDLYQYCYRVASVVGLSCIHIWGFKHDDALKLAETAGIAFQLTNILRDLGEDIARGRIYLPEEDLKRFDYTEQDLAQHRCTEEQRALMQFQIERARQFYRDSEPLADLLARPGRAVFLVMHRTYRAILDVIEQRNYDVFSSRARLGKMKKIWLVLQVLPIRWGWV